MTEYQPPRIGIVGLGFVGGALLDSFSRHQIPNIVTYDKYKHNNNHNNNQKHNILNFDILFLCLPTPFSSELNDYDIQPIHETLSYLQENQYSGLVVIKSTVTPTTCQSLRDQYQIPIIHNPEFLTARTANEDFHNQKHIVLGLTNHPTELSQKESIQRHQLISFYQHYYPNAEISICQSGESEAMKIYVNTFYAIKIQAFNEFHQLSTKLNLNPDLITNLMLKNGWINPMHTQVPGTDGQLSYGGGCFPKDTNALLHTMKKHQTPHQVLESTIQERNHMRQEN